MSAMTPTSARVLRQRTNATRLPTAENEINTANALDDVSTQAEDENDAGGPSEQQSILTTSTKSNGTSQQSRRRLGPRKFTLYPKLPVEIKSRIIEYAMTPRILELRLDTTAEYGTIPIELRGGPVPALLLVNKATRDEALRKYKKVANPQADIWYEYGASLYFNPQIDTLFIVEWTYGELDALSKYLPFNLLNAFDNADPARYIRHVAFSQPRVLPHWALYNDHPFSDRFCELLLHYPNLQNLDIVYDNRKLRTQNWSAPENFVFTEAVGIAHSLGYWKEQYITTQKYDMARFAEYFDNFETERGLEEKKDKQVTRFWEENPEWKRPTVGGVSIIQKPGLRKQAGRGKK